jgi:hypothetical protein
MKKLEEGNKEEANERMSVASASPDGEILWNDPEADIEDESSSEAPRGYVKRTEVDELVKQAYLRGRNEAIEARWESDPFPAIPPDDGDCTTDCIEDTFGFRKSVWDDAINRL